MEEREIKVGDKSFKIRELLAVEFDEISVNTNSNLLDAILISRDE